MLCTSVVATTEAREAQAGDVNGKSKQSGDPCTSYTLITVKTISEPFLQLEPC